MLACSVKSARVQVSLLAEMMTCSVKSVSSLVRCRGSDRAAHNKPQPAVSPRPARTPPGKLCIADVDLDGKPPLQLWAKQGGYVTEARGRAEMALLGAMTLKEMEAAHEKVWEATIALRCEHDNFRSRADMRSPIE